MSEPLTTQTNLPDTDKMPSITIDAAKTFSLSYPEQHIYNHFDKREASISVKAERNSKSINWEVSISGAETPEQATRLLRQTIDLVKAELAKENPS